MAGKIDSLLNIYLRNKVRPLHLQKHDFTRSAKELDHLNNQHILPQEIDLLTSLLRNNSKDKNFVRVDEFSLAAQEYKEFCDYENKSKNYKNAIDINSKTIKTLESANALLRSDKSTDYAGLQGLERLYYSKAEHIFNETEISSPVNAEEQRTSDEITTLQKKLEQITIESEKKKQIVSVRRGILELISPHVSENLLKVKESQIREEIKQSIKQEKARETGLKLKLQSAKIKLEGIEKIFSKQQSFLNAFKAMPQFAIPLEGIETKLITIIKALSTEPANPEVETAISGIKEDIKKLAEAKAEEAIAEAEARAVEASPPKAITNIETQIAPTLKALNKLLEPLSGYTTTTYTEDLVTNRLDVDLDLDISFGEQIQKILRDNHEGNIANLIITPTNTINWAVLNNISSNKKVVELINTAITKKFDEFVSEFKSYNKILQSRMDDANMKKDELLTISKSDINKQIAKTKAALIYTNKESTDDIIEEQQELTRFFNLLDQLRALWSNSFR